MQTRVTRALIETPACAHGCFINCLGSDGHVPLEMKLSAGESLRSTTQGHAEHGWIESPHPRSKPARFTKTLGWYELLDSRKAQSDPFVKEPLV
jgi:hypothetical protein